MIEDLHKSKLIIPCSTHSHIFFLFFNRLAYSHARWKAMVISWRRPDCYRYLDTWLGRWKMKVCFTPTEDTNSDFKHSLLLQYRLVRLLNNKLLSLFCLKHVGIYVIAHAINILILHNTFHISAGVCDNNVLLNLFCNANFAYLWASPQV